MPGVVAGDLVLDTPPVKGKEDTGYPTQKPLALLEHIIKASSNEGDIVLDPFCGCATACVAAERLHRNGWYRHITRCRGHHGGPSHGGS